MNGLMKFGGLDKTKSLLRRLMKEKGPHVARQAEIELEGVIKKDGNSAGYNAVDRKTKDLVSAEKKKEKEMVRMAGGLSFLKRRID